MGDNISILDSSEQEVQIATKEIGGVHANKTVSIDESGNYLSNDPMLDIARGAITGLSKVNKFGRNADIDTGSVPEDIWSHGGVWVAPTAARVHNISSSSANDIAGGTGIRTIQVCGLDENWEEAEEEVTMNGTSAVGTSKTYVRIFRMYGTTAGSNGTNVGTIEAEAAVDGTVTAEIMAGMGQTLMAIYTVPAGKTAYQVYGDIITNKSGSTSAAQADFEIRIRPNADTADPVWRVAWSGGCSLDGTSQIVIKKMPYGKLTEKTDIIARCTYTSDSNMDVSCAFNLILEDN